MNKELKPCPFCGKKPLIRRTAIGYASDYHTEVWEILCENCGCKLTKEKFTSKFQIDWNGQVEYVDDGRTDAIEAWNRRATDE